MAPGDGPSDRAVPQVPAVCPSNAALHLVASGASHYQDCVILYHLGLGQRGELTGGYRENDLKQSVGLCSHSKPHCLEESNTF